jgi:hypothetical protein
VDVKRAEIEIRLKREMIYPVQEVTFFFLITGLEEWMAYVDKMPYPNRSGQFCSSDREGFFRKPAKQCCFLFIFGNSLSNNEQ